MRFYTQLECEEWLSTSNRMLPDPKAQLARHDLKLEDFRIYALARWIASEVTYRDSVLLWVTEWSIWPSSENWHLYYALRNLRGDQRLLHEAPGHLFLAHEMEDFTSFLQLCILNGWGGFILTHADYVNAFFSHDEYMSFYAKKEANLSGVREFTSAWSVAATPTP